MALPRISITAMHRVSASAAPMIHGILRALVDRPGGGGVAVVVMVVGGIGGDGRYSVFSETLAGID